MPLSFDTTADMLCFVSEKGVGSVHAQGYHWYWRELEPVLQTLCPTSPYSAELMANCLYVAGDVHDINQAPKAAIAYYQKALALDPDLPGAHRELGQMYTILGEFDAALSHAERAVALWPEDKFCVEGLAETKAAIKANDDPFYAPEDAVWAAFEHLALAAPLAAIDALSGQEDEDASRARLHCFGALKKTDEYLQGWQVLVNAGEPIFFELSDHFFMDDAVYEAPEIWRIFLDSKAEFTGFITDYKGLAQSKIYRMLTESEQFRLHFDYNFLSASHDKVGLKRLHQRYPEWQELADLVTGPEPSSGPGHDRLA